MTVMLYEIFKKLCVLIVTKNNCGQDKSFQCRDSFKEENIFCEWNLSARFR